MEESKPKPSVIIFPRTLSSSEMERIEKEFSGPSVISRIIKGLAEKGPQSQYDMKKLLPSRRYGTVLSVVEELKRRKIIRVVKHRQDDGRKRVVYGLDFPYGFLAAIAYVQEDLDMKAVQHSNNALIQALEEEDRETVSELARIWFNGDREALISYCQLIFTKDPGDECIWAVLKAEDPPPSELDTSPKGVTYSSVLVKTDIACRLDKAVLPWKDRRQSRHTAS